MFIIGYYDHDREKSTERPVRLDRTEGHVIIEGKAYPARELVEALAQSGYAELRALGDSLILGRKRITPIFKGRQERAMAALCHGSLAFCCPMSKRCAERDRALEMLGLTQRDYEQMKSMSHLRFIDLAKGHSPDRQSMDDSGIRTANRPAVDYGYGRDDYRRDFDAMDGSFRRDEYRSHSPQSSWGRESHPQPGHSEREKADPYSDLGSLFGGQTESQVAISSQAPSCTACPDESIEGIGALFSQGELSPFNDDARDDQNSRGFCFSCGRTFRVGTKVCPWCGVTQ